MENIDDDDIGQRHEEVEEEEEEEEGRDEEEEEEEEENDHHDEDGDVEDGPGDDDDDDDDDNGDDDDGDDDNQDNNNNDDDDDGDVGEEEEDGSNDHDDNAGEEEEEEVDGEEVEDEHEEEAEEADDDDEEEDHDDHEHEEEEEQHEEEEEDVEEEEDHQLDTANNVQSGVARGTVQQEEEEEGRLGQQDHRDDTTAPLQDDDVHDGRAVEDVTGTTKTISTASTIARGNAKRIETRGRGGGGKTRRKLLVGRRGSGGSGGKKNPPKKRRKQQVPKRPTTTSKRRGGSATTSSVADGGGATGTATGGGSGYRTVKVTRQSQSQPSPIDVLDDAPDRLVNPLVVTPAEAYAPSPFAVGTRGYGGGGHVGHGGGGGKSAAATTAAGATGSHGKSVGGHSVPLRSYDLWPVLQVPFHQPDTYPLSYLARLLGYDIPVAKPTTKTGDGHGDDNGDDNDPRYHSSNFVAWDDDKIRPTLRKLRDMQDEMTGVYKIPPFGTFASRVWKKKLGKGSKDDEEDEEELDDVRVLGHLRDPLYQALCHPLQQNNMNHGKDNTSTKTTRSSSKSSGNNNNSTNHPYASLAVTSQQINTKIVPATLAGIMKDRFEFTVKDACEMNVLRTPSQQQQEQQQQQQQQEPTTPQQQESLEQNAHKIEVPTPRDGDDGDDGCEPQQDRMKEELEEDGATKSKNEPVSQDEGKHKIVVPGYSDDEDAKWTVSTLQAFRDHNPELVLPVKLTDPTACGLCLFYKNTPIAMALYTFEWYPTTPITVVANSNNSNSSNNKSTGAALTTTTITSSGRRSSATGGGPSGKKEASTASGSLTTAAATGTSSSTTQVSQPIGYELVMILQDVLDGNTGNSILGDFCSRGALGGGSDEEEEEAQKQQQERDGLIATLIALALEHARICRIAYAVFRLATPLSPCRQAWLQRLFRLRRQRPKNLAETNADATNAGDNNVKAESASVPNEAGTSAKLDGDGRKEEANASTHGFSSNDIVKKEQEGNSLLASESESAGALRPTVGFVCDLQKCSSKYAFFAFLDSDEAQDSPVTLVGDDDEGITVPPHRWLARLPSVDEAKSALADSSTALAVLNRAKKSDSNKPSPFFTGASHSIRSCEVRLRVKTPPARNAQQNDRTEEASISNENCPSSSGTQIFKLDISGQEIKVVETPPLNKNFSIELMRDFQLPPTERVHMAKGFPTPNTGVETDIVKELRTKQTELRAVEESLEPVIHKIMDKVLDERWQYESFRDSKQQSEQEEVLKEYMQVLDRRREQDLEWQKQLEQDMDAVCDVCNDGEVVHGNSILFCEACNVAVHQFCYGIDEIPEGDYYCKPCRFLGRDNAHAVAKSGIRPAATALPICCELCPRKQGAFIRSATNATGSREEGFGKWCHAVCAKWLGLNFVKAPDLLEDVTELKYSFRRLGIKCCLCRGERGGMNQCRYDGCQNWLHVTCARAVGTCEVIHGENFDGSVPENPWTLMCPEHSKIKPQDIPEGSVSISALIKVAKEFPPEQKPPSEEEIAPKPFNTATGKERKLLLKNRQYENDLLLELTEKIQIGARCDVCDVQTFSKTRARCKDCAIVLCKDCIVKDADGTDGSFRCAACSYKMHKRKVGEDFKAPRCLACYKKGGWLRSAFAIPVNRKSKIERSKDYHKTLFGQQIWAHALCTYWLPKLILNHETGQVDCSNVIMTTGKSLIDRRSQCFLCGQNGGLKRRCGRDGCCYNVNGKLEDTLFHITCARQACFEVNFDESSNEFNAFVYCYRHSGNEFNLRAKLEDLIEVEKLRSGKSLAKEDAPMKFKHASHLLHLSIYVLRMLSWAWRWAELWVDYDSSWEPLLEAGEREEQMTKEQLKIVDSTRESRCYDARKCRLAAFGAALRNRDYDKDDDYDRESFDRALRSILSTPSLVGPLKKKEIDFFAHWLSLAYWSKSSLLGIGDDKIEVNEESPFCRHIEDNSPKHILGSRVLPGSVSLTDPGDLINETDDFMKSEIVADEFLCSRAQTKKSPRSTRREFAEDHSACATEDDAAENQQSPSDRRHDESDCIVASDKSVSKRPRGRPPKKTKEAESNIMGDVNEIPRKELSDRPLDTAVAESDNEISEEMESSGKSQAVRDEEIRTSKGKGMEVFKKRRGPGRPRKIRANVEERTPRTNLNRLSKSSIKRPATADSSCDEEVPPKKRLRRVRRTNIQRQTKKDASHLQEANRESENEDNESSNDSECGSSYSDHDSGRGSNKRANKRAKFEKGPVRSAKKKKALEIEQQEQSDSDYMSSPREQGKNAKRNLTPPPTTRRRKQEVTPAGDSALESNRYDMVKNRRRQPANRLVLRTFSGRTYKDAGEPLQDKDLSVDDEGDSVGSKT